MFISFKAKNRYVSAGFLIDRYRENAYATLGVSNLILALTTVLTPFSGTLVSLLFCTGFCGMALASLFTGRY